MTISTRKWNYALYYNGIFNEFKITLTWILATPPPCSCLACYCAPIIVHYAYLAPFYTFAYLPLLQCLTQTLLHSACWPGVSQEKRKDKTMCLKDWTCLLKGVCVCVSLRDLSLALPTPTACGMNYNLLLLSFWTWHDMVLCVTFTVLVGPLLMNWLCLHICRCDSLPISGPKPPVDWTSRYCLVVSSQDGLKSAITKFNSLKL